jgi:hypothetical protein
MTSQVTNEITAPIPVAGIELATHSITRLDKTHSSDHDAALFT